MPKPWSQPPSTVHRYLISEVVIEIIAVLPGVQRPPGSFFAFEGCSVPILVFLANNQMSQSRTKGQLPLPGWSLTLRTGRKALEISGSKWCANSSFPTKKTNLEAIDDGYWQDGSGVASSTITNLASQAVRRLGSPGRYPQLKKVH
jgi:hypothetical protein